jgi:hypothetical protein
MTDKIREALEWIVAQQYQDRDTVTPENAFEAFVKINRTICAIYDRASEALAALASKPGVSWADRKFFEYIRRNCRDVQINNASVEKLLSIIDALSRQQPAGEAVTRSIDELQFGRVLHDRPSEASPQSPANRNAIRDDRSGKSEVRLSLAGFREVIATKANPALEIWRLVASYIEDTEDRIIDAKFKATELERKLVALNPAPTPVAHGNQDIQGDDLKPSPSPQTEG